MHHTQALGPQEARQINEAFKSAGRRILFLDYDGTLAPFTIHPEDASPTAEVLKLLNELSDFPKTEVVVISGRGREILQRWLGRRPVHLVAEHGVWVRRNGEAWRLIKPLPNGWKSWVIPLFKEAAGQLPGIFVEEKEYSVVWHYRGADPEVALSRKKALMGELLQKTADSELDVLEGNKIIEIRNAGTSKAMVGTEFLASKEYDFILAIGDDTTDEDLFKVLPPRAYSIRVGKTHTNARFNIGGIEEVVALLKRLCGLAER